MKKIHFLPVWSAVFISIAMTLFTSTTNAQTVNKDWVGTYEFFDAQKANRRNQPGTSITYTLTISHDGTSLSTQFTADGTQTSDKYECSIQLSGNSVKVFFTSDLSAMEKEKFKPLKKGDLLFTLTKTKTGNKTKYLFKSDDYKIDLLSARAGTPIYFRKIK
jgi:hypothetical protein